MEKLSKIYWPLTHLEEGIEALAKCAHFPLNNSTQSKTKLTNTETLTKNQIAKCVEASAKHLGIEAEPAQLTHADLINFLKSSSHLIIALPQKEKQEPHFIAFIKTKKNHAILLTSKQKKTLIPLTKLCSLLCDKYESAVAKECEPLFGHFTAKNSHDIKKHYIKKRLAPLPITGIWVLRLSPGACFSLQMKQAGLFKTIFGYVGLYALQYLLFLFSWSIIGLGALNGSLDFGWLTAWAILLITLVPLNMWLSWLAGMIAIGTGTLMKRRLLTGALNLNPDDTKSQGMGQFLSRVIESENLETLSLSGGFLGVVAIIELVISAVILSLGAMGFISSSLLIIWSAIIIYLGYCFYKKRFSWTQTRLQATHDLLEKIVGHKTRIIQESNDNWFDNDDLILEKYATDSKKLDNTTTKLTTLATRGWLIVSILAIAPAFVKGEIMMVKTAISLGGVLLAYRAFSKLSQGVSHITDAIIAWQQIKTLFRAAQKNEINSSANNFLETHKEKSQNQSALIRGQDLFYTYLNRNNPVLNKCDIIINQGDKILFEGTSGSGKSTLSSILTGIREPTSGILLFNGLDKYTLGSDAWHQAIVSAPQFHENHIMTGTFAFNLLMGRNWPANPEDYAKAAQICHELGLGDVLSKMPAGLMQMVGETGWQLSHGEKSRLYIARALLQKAKLIILDESFAALDPENLKQCIDCVLKRANTLLIIAHP